MKEGQGYGIRGEGRGFAGEAWPSFWAWLSFPSVTVIFSVT